MDDDHSDHDDDHDDHSDHEDSEHDNSGHSGATLTGFLFGNINKEFELEDDVLDEDSKRHLSGLSGLGLRSMVKEITDNEANENGSDADNSDDADKKSDTAVDYSNINEMADEEEEELAKVKDAMLNMSAPKSGDDDDYDEDDVIEKKDDKKLMPPPNWIPSTTSPSKETESNQIKSETEIKKEEVIDPSKLITPLAAMLPEEYRNVDVKEMFPEFRPGQVMRFSRLFKPVYTPHIYKRKKKKEEKEKPKEAVEGKPKDSDHQSKPELENKSDSESTEINVETVDGEEKPKEEEKVEVKEEPMDIKTEEEEEREDEEYWPFQLNMGRPAEPDEIMMDDGERLVKAVETETKKTDSDPTKDIKPKIAEWRFGPAQLWYDMLGIDETGEDFDYGFKLREEGEERQNVSDSEAVSGPELPRTEKANFTDDTFQMVNQVHWEDDIIYNGEDARQKVMQSQKTRGPAAGWIPSSTSRTAAQYFQQVAGKTLPSSSSLPSTIPGGGFKLGSNPMGQSDGSSAHEPWYSIFPPENEELLYGRWEDDIIWDAQNMEKMPKPSVLSLDPNDENIIFEIPDDRDPNETQSEEASGKKEKTQEIRKSKILLGKAGIIKEEEEEEEEDTNALQYKDPYNLSNDEYYNPKVATDNVLRTNLGGSMIQHSTPAVELRQPFFPTHLGPIKLRTYHRPPLKRYSHGPMAGPGPHAVLPLLKQIKRKAKMRETERLASGGGDMFFMRTAEDLTGKDGDLIFAEYSEEYPPLVMQVGMATKIKNYYKRKPGKDNNPPKYEFGELAYAHTSPFLGSLTPGQCIQAFENHMFRASVYQHKVADTDFLVIRTRQHYYIRDVKDIFTVGQACPLMEVPGPNSKKANNFIRDFLQVFIFRLFLKSKDNPKRIKMEEIKKAYPTHPENTIRKRLKLCADFKRTGMDSNWWVLKPDFRLPSEEELRAMVSPEQCCGFYSMLAAEQRLKDAGYGEKSLFAPEENDDDDNQIKIEDEVQVAPWNTTRAYLSAMKGRCLLALSGPADPTGCGEGFSYIKVPNKPSQNKDEQSKDTPQKKTVTGTDADLRKLSLKDAKSMLRKFGVPEGEIKKLSRWEVIDVVRTMSTEQAKAGQEGGGISKFARGNRFSVAEHQERYKEECQRIFDLQNRMLGSSEQLSTDEDSSSDDSDFEEMGKNIENMLSNKKTSSQLNNEREEAERRELHKLMMGDDNSKDNKDSKKRGAGEELYDGPGRKLKITRTFRNEDNREYTRTEIVSKPNVIDTYVRIRQTKDPNFIRQFATMDEAQKEEMKKERRRIQEQLRRIKRNQDKPMAPPKIKKTTIKKKKLTPLNMKLKCGACGGVGHMRTNKECPMYQKAGTSTAPIQVAMTEEQEEEEEKINLDDRELVNVEGTKVKLSKTLLEHADQIRRKSLVLKFPKMVAKSKKKRRVGSIIHCDYLKKPHKQAHRRRADPVITMSSIFENILNEMRDLPNTQPFLFPVNSKLVLDYHRIIERPMDLQTIRENIRNRKYLSREQFLVDVNLIGKNSEKYNGPKSALTATANKLMELCLRRVAEKEEKFMRLEKAINPLLDDNDLVAFSFILEGIVTDRLKTIENSWPFHQPVNKKFVKDYYEIIKKPMDLGTLLKRVKQQKYHTSEQFIDDVALIYENSVAYNGKDSGYTATALKMVDVARSAISEQEEHVNQLVENIHNSRIAALEAAEMDSMTGTSFTGGALDGADLESVDSQGMVTKENVTIAEDASMDSATFQSQMYQSEYSQNVSRDEDFVDVEGDEDIYSSRMQDGQEYDESLAQDLQITPDNSDDEDDDKLAKLSSEGSDSDQDYEERYSSMDLKMQSEDHQIPMDENAQDYSYGDQSMMDQSNLDAVAQMEYEEGSGEESFDPNEFFKSFGGQQQQQQYQQEEERTDINTDLQLSESEGEEGSEGDFVPVDEDSNAEFNMDEFLKQE